MPTVWNTRDTLEIWRDLTTNSTRLTMASPCSWSTSTGRSCLGGRWSRPCHSRGMCTHADRKSSAARGHSCWLGPSWPAAAAAVGLSSEAAVERSTL